MLDRPELRLGLSGFPPALAQAVAVAVRTLDARWRPAWHVDTDPDPDAWLLHGDGRESVAGDGFSADRPAVALNWPEGVDPMRHTQALSDAVLSALLRVELGMRVDLAAYRVGSSLWRRHSLGLGTTGTWLLSAQDKPVAVIDFSLLRLRLDALATQDEIAQAQWIDSPQQLPKMRMPAAMPVARAMWTFARHYPEHLMPVAYRLALFTPAPGAVRDGLRLSAVGERVLRSLVDDGPLRFKQISEATGLGSRVLGNALVALIFVGALQVVWPESTRNVIGRGFSASRIGELESQPADDIPSIEPSRASDVGWLTRSIEPRNLATVLRSWASPLAFAPTLPGAS